MNYLAHLFLSCKDDDLLIGNFLTDFLKKKETDQLAERFQAGVRLHRKIDQFTDTHPMVIQGVRRMYPAHSKYATVIVDVLYDYFLIHNWNDFTDESFIDFRLRIYDVLRKNIGYFPARIHHSVRNMVSGDWLQSYGTPAGLDYTFSRMSHRASKPDLLANGLRSLQEHEQALNSEFLAFFPDVIKEVECFC